MSEAPARGGRVVAVFGYSRRRDAELNPICSDRLRHAERLAVDARAVILSGWARKPKSRPEAELMRSAWAGPDVPLICDPDARSTADNAANVAATARALGAEELVVVTSRWHARRARILLQAALRDSGVHLSVEGAPDSRPRTVVARELAFIALVPLQLRRARRGARTARPG